MVEKTLMIVKDSQFWSPDDEPVYYAMGDKHDFAHRDQDALADAALIDSLLQHG